MYNNLTKQFEEVADDRHNILLIYFQLKLLSHSYLHLNTNSELI